jgi:hypothetical protein
MAICYFAAWLASTKTFFNLKSWIVLSLFFWAIFPNFPSGCWKYWAGCRRRERDPANSYHRCTQRPTVRQTHALSCESARLTKDTSLASCGKDEKEIWGKEGGDKVMKEGEYYGDGVAAGSC